MGSTLIPLSGTRAPAAWRHCLGAQHLGNSRSRESDRLDRRMARQVGSSRIGQGALTSVLTVPSVPVRPDPSTGFQLAT